MADGDMARLFHRLTSYEPGREWTDTVPDPWIVTSFEPNDLELLPPPVKEFPAGLPVVPLPRELPTSPHGALATLAGETTKAATLDLAQLARLLHLSAGVVRTTKWQGGDVPLPRRRVCRRRGSRWRCTSSSARRLPRPSAGRVRLWACRARARPGRPSAGRREPGIVVTGVPWRTGWRYRERGYRHIFWDAGTMLSQLLALAASVGLPARLYTDFPDVELRDLDGRGRDRGVPGRRGRRSATAPPGWTQPHPRRAGLDESPGHFPLVTATHWAGVELSLG